MTGIYVRVKRGDRWTNAEFTSLTKEEMYSVTKDKSKVSLESWVVVLASWIRDNVVEIPPGEEN